MSSEKPQQRCFVGAKQDEIHGKRRSIWHADPTVELAYIDESGNSGYTGTVTYSLGCVIVQADAWPRIFDDLIGFRRYLRSSFGLRVRGEVKANFLIRNTGPFVGLGLGDDIRHRIYRAHMRLAPRLGLEVCAVVIVKERILKRSYDPREIAWEYLLQRLERRSTKSHEPIMVVHDEGEEAVIRKLARKARRAGTAGSAFGTGMLQRPARLLIDDPVPRRSDQSYLIQMADLVAYAAFRHVIPPGRKIARVCPQGMFDELGSARIPEVTRLKGGHPGLVEWPP